MRIKLFLIFSTFFTVHSLDNGLLPLPPMGWMSWLSFACEINCTAYPNECINDKLYLEMIDRIANDGYLQLGYNTVNIDDCWMNKNGRDPVTNRLVADRTRFPGGIKPIVEYAHKRGVLLGIYEDVGTKTCCSYVGTRNETFDFTQIDARTFSDWKVDSLKLDGCNEPDDVPYNRSYPEYSKALARQSHKIAFACSWPAYKIGELEEKDYALIKDNCNYWRNFDDIMDSWSSVQSIIEFYRKNAPTFAKFHGPGGWFDADMIIVGNDGLSYEQSKSQMAFWCLWSVPLLMSNDLRVIKPEFKAILLNRHLIAVNQDPLGIMGHNVVLEGKKQVWVKKLSPDDASGLNSYAVLYFNDNVLGVPAIVRIHIVFPVVHYFLPPPRCHISFQS